MKAGAGWVVVLALAAGALVAPPFANAALVQTAVKGFDPTAVKYDWTTHEQFDALKKAAAERGKRAPASAAALGDDLMSPEMKAFRDKFLAVKTAEQLDALMDQLDKGYDAAPADLKFVSTQLLPMRALRSIVWKMVPLVHKTRMAQSVLLTGVKQVASSMRVYLPTEQWEAGFAYVSEPFSGDDRQFGTENDLQVYLANVAYPELLKSSTRLAALQNLNITWDNKLLYGVASFQDSIDRYRQLGEAERYSALSSTQAGLAWIAMFCAYRVDGGLNVAQEVGTLYGVDGFDLLRGVEGAPADRRVEILRKGKYQHFLELYPTGAQWTQLAFKHITESTYNASVAWAEVKDRPAAPTAAIDPSWINPASRQIGLSMPNIEAMLQGRTELRSAITGETATVDIPAFYSNPPKDLKAFLPTQFDQGEEYLHKNVPTASGGTKSVKYRNYFRGRPTGWDVAAYQAYLPDVKSSGDVIRASRVLSQSWGGAGPAGASALMVQ